MMPFLVRRLERVGDLSGDGQRLVEWDWSLGDAVGQRGALDQFQHEARTAPALSLTKFFQAVDRRDVWMVEGGQQFGFPLESGQSIEILRERIREGP